MSSTTATANHPGHVSAWGLRLGGYAPLAWFGPAMLAACVVVGVCFAPPEVRVAWAIPAAAAGVIWALVFPALYYRGWLRWVGLLTMLAVLVVGVAGYLGLLAAILAIFG